MKNSEVNTELNNLKTVFIDGKHWNHIDGEPVDLNSTTEFDCGTHGGKIYTCNNYAGKSQCYAFAWYIANRIFATHPDVSNITNNTIDAHGWHYFTKGNCGSLILEPGDIIRADGHSAVVVSIDQTTDELTVLEVWGTEGCEINWGYFNDSPNNTVSRILRDAEYIVKAPKLYLVSFVEQGTVK